MNPLLSAIEQQVRDHASELASVHVAARAADIDDSGRCPDELIERLCALVDGHADGAEPSPMHLALRLEQVARHSAAAAAIAAAHGVGSWAVHQGSGRDRTRIAGPGYATVCGGTTLVADATADGTRLQGSVALVPGAAYATDFVVACESGTAAGLFTVSAGSANVGAAEALLGLSGSGAAAVSLDRVGVAQEACVGNAELAARVVDAVRIAHAAQAVGIAASALDAALAHVTSTAVAGELPEQPQSVQWMLADIATETEAARLLLWHAALDLDAGEGRQAAAMCRLLGAEAAVAATRRAVQIAGEGGTLRTSILERLYRDAKVMEVLGGTNEQQLSVIADGLLPELTR